MNQTREQMIEKIVAGTNRERERRGFSNRVTVEMYDDFAAEAEVEDEFLPHLLAELEMLERLYETDRAAWEALPAKKLKELGAVVVTIELHAPTRQ